MERLLSKDTQIILEIKPGKTDLILGSSRLPAKNISILKIDEDICLFFDCDDDSEDDYDEGTLVVQETSNAELSFLKSGELSYIRLFKGKDRLLVAAIYAAVDQPTIRELERFYCKN